jgi:polyisoprenoid-binding protein YceI
MKHFPFKTIALSLATYALMTLPASAAPIQYTIVPAQSHIAWSVNQADGSAQTGKFVLPTGEIVLDEEVPEQSHITITLNVAQEHASDSDTDKQIRSKEFLDAVQFSSASFVSSKIISTSKDHVTINGNLTLHGITKPITVQANLVKHFVTASKQHAAEFKASAKFKRSEFGVMGYLPGIEDDVTLSITVIAIQK